MYEKEIVLVFDKVLGYYYFIDYAHPFGVKCGKIYYHRHVVSLKIGRWLLKSEIVHHIDGNKKNNSPDNLEILTKAEHTHLHMAEKFGERGFAICKCGTSFFGDNKLSKFCSSGCARNYSRRFEITKEELAKLVWDIPMTKIAKMFNVSDVAIKKRCKLLGIKTPHPGYWRQKETGTLPDVDKNN